MKRTAVIRAALAGGSLITTARKAGVSRITLYRWLKAYDPDRPVASARAQKTGPKGPRWGDGEIDTVISIIGHNPELWSRRRLAVALAERGIAVSDKTAGVILKAAGERIARERDREERARLASERREAAMVARFHASNKARREFWRERLRPAFARELPPSERFRLLGEALSENRWKIRVDDMTPELEDLADSYFA